MSDVFETYRSRKIEFLQVSEIDNWMVKMYSITSNPRFSSMEVQHRVIKKLPLWLKKAKASELPTYNIAFLILHEAREGVWILINWWTGGEMINTKVYFSNYQTPHIIRKSPYAPHSLLCVWELEIFDHERRTWIREILLNAQQPRFKNYLESVITN